MPVPAVPTASEAVRPFAPTTSSVLPSAVIAEERIDELIVSPVANEAVMIAVASISPATISAARPRPAAGVADAEAEEDAIPQREHRDDCEQDHHEHREHFRERADRDPEQLLHGLPRGRWCLRDDDVVRLATRRRPEEHHVGQLLDL